MWVSVDYFLLFTHCLIDVCFISLAFYYDLIVLFLIYFLCLFSCFVYFTFYCVCVCCVFALFCVLFLPMYIVVYFLFVYILQTTSKWWKSSCIQLIYNRQGIMLHVFGNTTFTFMLDMLNI
jgi:hypothetical protein